MADSVVDLGGSSRSPSPASDDIDNDFDIESQEQLKASLKSPAQSAQQRTRTAHTRGGSSQAKRRTASTKKFGGSRGTEDAEHAVASGSHFQGAWAELQVGQGGMSSAFDKLLDVDYPRDFGDPVLRYNQAKQAYHAAMSQAQAAFITQAPAPYTNPPGVQAPMPTQKTVPNADASMTGA